MRADVDTGDADDQNEQESDAASPAAEVGRDERGDGSDHGRVTGQETATTRCRPMDVYAGQEGGRSATRDERLDLFGQQPHADPRDEDLRSKSIAPGGEDDERRNGDGQEVAELHHGPQDREQRARKVI